MSTKKNWPSIILLHFCTILRSRREFGNTIMTKPLTHALPYMVGMLVGKWLTATPTSYSFRFGGNRSLTTLFGLTACIVALAEVFLPYKWNNSHLPTRFLASLYAALFRFGWSLVLAYLVISCRHRRGKRCRDEKVHANCESCDSRSRQKLFQQQQHQHQHQVVSSSEKWRIPMTTTIEQQLSESVVVVGRDEKEEESMCLCGSGGSVVNRLLSLNVFTHLSKLSFVAYLIHLPLMSVFISQTRGLFAFSHTLVMHLALSYLVMTFVLSFVLVHIIEFPFITFETYLFKRLLNNIGLSSESLNEKMKPETVDRKNRRVSEFSSTGAAVAPSEYFKISERL